VDSKTSRANKRKGAGFEAAVTLWFRSLGYSANRLARRGKNDEGDVVVDLGDTVFVIEAKAVKSLSLSEWLAESQTEADNYAQARGLDPERVIPLVVVKRRMKGVSQSYAVIELQTLTRIIGI
jgi:Holliday junction resolvase